MNPVDEMIGSRSNIIRPSCASIAICARYVIHVPLSSRRWVQICQMDDISRTYYHLSVVTSPVLTRILADAVALGQLCKKGEQRLDNCLDPQARGGCKMITTYISPACGLRSLSWVSSFTCGLTLYCTRICSS
jgi:hypothetical protein